MVRIESGWNDQFRNSRLDVRTYYRHRVRNAHSRSAELDVYIERIEIFEDGFFVGAVRRIPDNLAHVRARIRRGGAMQLDRELFIVGDPHVGFELISARHYGGYILDRYDRRHGYRAGRLDFRRERVVPVRRSRFFDPYDFNGFVPVGLLPENEIWLADYGRRAPSRHWYGVDDILYYGRTSDLDDYAILNGDRTHYDQVAPRTGTSGRSDRLEPLSDRDDVQYRTERGVEVRMRRESTLERVE